MANQLGYEGDSPQDLQKEIERLREIGHGKWWSDFLPTMPAAPISFFVFENRLVAAFTAAVRKSSPRSDAGTAQNQNAHRLLF